MDFGSLCSKSLCEAPNAPNFGFWRKILDFGDFVDFGDFGFWILGISDFGFWGFWILGILDFGSWGFWILDFGAEIQNPKSPNPKSKIQTFLADFGDFGFWILDRYVANLYVRPPTPQIWRILDFGFWGFWILGILDFGFWGFWILDFGDFGVWGFWILDFGFCDKFWILHKKKKTVHADPGRRIFSHKAHFRSRQVCVEARVLAALLPLPGGEAGGHQVTLGLTCGKQH